MKIKLRRALATSLSVCALTAFTACGGEAPEQEDQSEQQEEGEDEGEDEEEGEEEDD